jgi:amino acid permease
VRSAFLVGWVVWFASIVAAVLYALGFAFFAVDMSQSLLQLFTGNTVAWLGSRFIVSMIAIAATLVYTFALLRRSGGGSHWVNFGKVFFFIVLIVAALFSMLTALRTNLFAASRVVMTMGQDRTMTHFLDGVSEKRGTPTTAIWATALLVVTLLLVLPDVAVAGAASSLIFLISFAITHSISYLTRRRGGTGHMPFKVPLFPLIPITGVLACLSLALFQGISVPSAGRNVHDQLRARLLSSIVRTRVAQITFLKVFSENTALQVYKKGRQDLNRFARDEVHLNYDVKIARNNNIAEEIIKQAHNHDLIVLGLQRFSRRRRTFGEITLQIAGNLDCAILMINHKG